MGCHPKREGDGYRASCPGPNHANGNRRNPALSIRQGDRGRVLATCHSGCDFGDIVSALGLDAARGPGTTPHGPNAWVYRDAAGVALLTVHRRDTAGGGKRIWRDPKGAKPPKGGWPLLRLPSLRANPDRPMLVVEGERTCDHAGFLFGDRYECTTAVGGAGKARQADWTPAKDRRVAICPDNDDAGYRHAQDVATRCREAGAREVRIVQREDLEPCAKGWDLADQPPPGFDVEAVLESPGSVVSLPAEDTPDGLRVDTDWRQPPLPRRWLIDGWLAAGRIALLSGRGGAGKSKLAVQLAYAIAAGRQEWFEGGPKLNDIGNPIVFASWEDEREELHRRLLDNPDLRFEGAEGLHDRVVDRFQFVDMAGEGPLWEENGRDRGTLTEAGVRLRARCSDAGARILVIDPIAGAYAGSEITRSAVRAFLSSWDAWGRAADCTVLLIGHPPKGDHGDDSRYSGSTDWRNGVRSFLWLERGYGMADRAKLTADKVSYGPRPEPVPIEHWTWWRAAPVDRISDEKITDEIRARMFAALRDRGPLSKNKLTLAMGGKAQRAREVIEAAESSDEISLTIKGQTHVYDLPGEPRPETPSPSPSE